MLRELVLRNRSYRRFHQSPAIDLAMLRELVDLARLSPSAANRQPLRYILSADPATNARIFPHMGWAGYLADWPGPEEGERPTGYVVMLADRRISPTVDCDHGIAAQTILLGAAEMGFGGCMIGSIQRDALRAALSIPDDYAILLVLAMGKPSETVVLEACTGDIKYWRDPAGVHHVPKRSLDEIVLR
jgi:nitroreductase